MARVPDVPFEELTEEQKRVHNEIAGSRSGSVRGPFALWIRNPALAERASQFGDALRLHGKLERRLFELTVLIVARHWSAQYEWYTHERSALKVGLSADVVAAIRDRKPPEFAREDERLIYEVVSEINEKRTLGQASYDRALAALGLDLLIELIAVAGFYSMVAMTLNAFDAPVPGGLRPLP